MLRLAWQCGRQLTEASPSSSSAAWLEHLESSLISSSYITSLLPRLKSEIQTTKKPILGFWPRVRYNFLFVFIGRPGRISAHFWQILWWLSRGREKTSQFVAFLQKDETEPENLKVIFVACVSIILRIPCCVDGGAFIKNCFASRVLVLVDSSLMMSITI